MTSELTLNLMMGPLSVQPAPREVMEALTEAKVTVSATGRSGFDLSFGVSKTSPILTRHLPGGFFDPPSRVVISATLRGVTTVLIDGVITHHEMVPSDEAGKSVLSLKGEDLTRMMDLIDLTGLPFAAMPPEVRILIILAKYAALYQILPLVIPSVLLEVPDPLEEVPKQSGTDYAYIKMLADRVGYDFYQQAGPLPGMSTVYWGPSLRTAIPFLPDPPPIAINWDGSSNVESLQFSFDGFAKTLFIIIIQESNSLIPIPIPIPDVTPLSPPLGQKSPFPLKVSPLQDMAKFNPLQAAAIGLAKASRSANVVTGSGSLDVLRYGSILNARTLVSVKGAGITYDGDYYVDSCTHTIKPGSYKQSFSLSRNALIAGGGLGALGSYLTSPVQELAGVAAAAPSPLGSLPGAGFLPGGAGVPGVNQLPGASSLVPGLPASPQ